MIDIFNTFNSKFNFYSFLFDEIVKKNNLQYFYHNLYIIIPSSEFTVIENSYEDLFNIF